MDGAPPELVPAWGWLKLEVPPAIVTAKQPCNTTLTKRVAVFAICALLETQKKPIIPYNDDFCQLVHDGSVGYCESPR